MLRKPIIVANWKMHKTLSEAKSFIEEIKTMIPSKQMVDSVVCPPSLFLEALVEGSKGSDVNIGAQNMFFEDSGAFTGEISPVALKDIGIKYVILGHSERRQIFNETDHTINKKILAAFHHGLIPIVCCGETLVQREGGLTFKFIEKQVKKALLGLTNEQVKQTVIAYEPIWAIGTGRASTVKDVNEVCTYIRQVIQEEFSQEAANVVRILYGGSVNQNNIQDFMEQPNIDGALVGGASLEPKSFLQLVDERIYK